MRSQAIQLLESMREQGVNDSTILEEIVYYYLSGDEAYQALESIANDYDISIEPYN